MRTQGEVAVLAFVTAALFDELGMNCASLDEVLELRDIISVRMPLLSAPGLLMVEGCKFSCCP